MATFNLIRNSRMFYTTNVNATTGIVQPTGHTTSNSQEITVLDGITFSQGTTSETVTLSEAGRSPVRGQRSFNTALNPVEFSFSTYIKPYLSTTVKADEAVLWNALMSSYPIGDANANVSFTFTGTLSVTYSAPRLTLTATTAITNPATVAAVGTTPSSTNLIEGEVVIMKGATGSGANEINSPVRVVSKSATELVVDFLTAPTSSPANGNFGGTGTLSFNRVAWLEHAAAAGDTGYTAAYSEMNTALSNINQLTKFGLVITVDGVTYMIHNCALNQASIDFALDGIATVAWTGSGTLLEQVTNNVTYTANGANWDLGGGTFTGTVKGRTPDSTAKYITNKLSTVALTKNIGGIGAGNTAFNLALTGGNLTIANNIQYITPANLGVVNSPIGYVTGGRSITGTINAYLRTGSTNTAGLLSDILTTSQSSSETKFRLDLSIGGSSNAVRVDARINGASMQVPTVDAQQVMSTTINFTAQGTDAILGATANYDIENTNDLRLRYFSS